MQKQRIYIAIDLKSFYASVECNERGLDPLNTNLVVADTSRTDKTICLAVSPSLKTYGIPGRARLYQVKQAVARINQKRLKENHWQPLEGTSIYADELKRHPEMKLDYIAARPQMALYIQYSANIYQTYLKYISPDDIHVYSIDECFIDATDYLKLYHTDAHSFARFLIKKVLTKTGITATAGIGTNMYLAKCAMDIVAKHIPADKDGVRITELNEDTYRRMLWTHKPITDFWRVGRGTAKRLAREGIYTMGDIARCSTGKFNDYYNEDLLYRIFGKNAELLIDHAWGYEPVEMKDIKKYQPENNSRGIGQVLSCGYSYQKGLTIIKEMADQLSLELVKDQLVTNEIALYIGYDAAALDDEDFDGETETDWYGRTVPKSVHGTLPLHMYTASGRILMQAAIQLYEKMVSRTLLIRRINITAVKVVPSSEEDNIDLSFTADNLFSPPLTSRRSHAKEELDRERKAQVAVLKIKEKYGKNAVVKGVDFEDGATARERNEQIGGHHK